MNKKDLSERDICTKFITPAVLKAGWDLNNQVKEEVYFTAGRVIVRGKLVSRGKAKRADYILYYKNNIPLAVIEAKDNKHSIGAGMQQAIEYAQMLDIPFVFSSNGDAFLFHDRTVNLGKKETELTLDQFPPPKTLWEKYKKFKGIEEKEVEEVYTQSYHKDADGKEPRYYQRIAVNRAVEAIAKGQNRVLLVMAAGTGKTYTAFQIIWRLWKAKKKKRILFLADRNILVDQTKSQDFAPFGDKMTKITKRHIDKSYEIYLALYQGLTGSDEDKDAYKQFSPDFFDLVVIDECRRGSAKEDSAWREVLDYFSSAAHLGLTATPKETKDVSNIEYFGEPVYTYSLKQGIEDGFLAPYKVIRPLINIDIDGLKLKEGTIDKYGNEVPDEEFNVKDFDKRIVIDERTELVSKRITEYLKKNNRYDKTIVFCVDIEHAARMRQALVNENSDMAAENSKYVMQITGDNDEGMTGDELINFINNDLFPYLQNLENDSDKRAFIIKNIFQDTYNYMKSGTLLRQVINKINEIDFNSSGDRHLFNDIYEHLLQSLQSAGNAGEYYTPRAVTQFIVDTINPKLGEKVLDPACGTGGFLACAAEHLKKQIKTAQDGETLNNNIFGIEKKPLPHQLCTTNMILHGIDTPINIKRDNTLSKPVNNIPPADRADCIITNPPFGGIEEEGIESNFPSAYRTKETADLFLLYITAMLKPQGRCGVVLPDGALFGEGVKTRIKEKLMTDCNLHTIIRLPKSVFAPYTSINTNILFFIKGSPTRETWFYRLDMPEGYKNFSKTKPMKREHLKPVDEWRQNKKEIEIDGFFKSKKYTIDEIKERNYNLDLCGYPYEEEEVLPPMELLDNYQKQRAELDKNIDEVLGKIKSMLGAE